MFLRLYVKGRKVAWGEGIAVLRPKYGIALILDNKMYTVGGLVTYRDLTWRKEHLVACTKELVFTMKGNDIKSWKVEKVPYDMTSVGATQSGFAFGTKEGEVILTDEKLNVIKTVKVGDGEVERIEVSASGYVLAVHSKYNLTILTPQGEVLVHHSYHWDLRAVRWSPDLSKMIILGDTVEFLTYDEQQGTYVKIDELDVKGLDAKWCGRRLCLLTEDSILIYDNDVKLEKPSKRLKFSGCEQCAWSPQCDGVALLGEKGLAIIKGI